jgi:hypothetical protein
MHDLFKFWLTSGHSLRLFFSLPLAFRLFTLLLSPDLAYDRSRDWSVYCLDPREQSHVYDSGSTGSVASKFSGVMTGMGLVSHALAEDERTLTPVSVAGKIIEDQGGEALEVILQMKPVRLSCYSCEMNVSY